MDLEQRFYEYKEFDYSEANLDNYVKNLSVGKILKVNDKNVKIQIFDRVEWDVPCEAFEYLLAAIQKSDSACFDYFRNNFYNEEVPWLSPSVNSILFVKQDNLTYEDAKTLEYMLKDSEGVKEPVLVFNNSPGMAGINGYSYVDGYTYKELS